MEPLEDRSLLSINPFVGPLTYDDIAAGQSAACPASASSEYSSVPTVDATSALDSAGTTTAAMATHYVVSLRAGTTVGAPVWVQLVASDDQNHFVSNYSGTADLVSSDASATLPASVTFHNGHAEFQVTFATQGQQTVTATNSADMSLSGTGATHVAMSAVATHLVLYMPTGSTIGKPVTVRVVAEDAQNDLVSNYSGTANLSSSDPSAQLPASVTFEHGYASFQVIFATQGQQTVTTTDNLDSSINGATTTSVAAQAVASHFVVYLSQGVATGVPLTVQVAAEDAENNFVSNYTGTANLIGSDASATLPATVTFQNGHANFQMTFATPGQQTVTATDSVDASLTGVATTNVAVPYFTMSMPSGVTAGAAVRVQLRAMDAQNQVMSSYSGTANLASSDSSATLPATVTFQNGRASFQVTFATNGQQTVTATDSVDASPIGTATTNVAATAVATHFVVTMTPGATSGTPVTVRIVPEDAQNHFVSNYSGTVNLTSSDGSATLPASVTFQQGQANFLQVTFATLGQQTVTATDSVDTSLTGTATTDVAAPAVATHFVVYLRTGASSGDPTLVRIVAEDAQNHFVSNYSGTVNLISTDGSATLPASVTLQNGHASLQVTFATLGQQTVTATVSVDASLTGTAATNVVAANSTSDGGQNGGNYSGGNFDGGRFGPRNFFSRFRG